MNLRRFDRGSRPTMPQQYSFQILAPPHAALDGCFPSSKCDPTVHREYLTAIQRLRGRLYLQDGAIDSAELDPRGGFQMQGDDDSWHLLLVDGEGEVIGCARYLIHPSSASFKDLRISQSALAQNPDWSAKVKHAVEADLRLAREQNARYVEIGGWALSEQWRGTRAALEIAVGSFALADFWGGAIGVCTATFRHGSASILRRLGGESFLFEGEALPVYEDPQYGCSMELLRFDYRTPAARYRPLVKLLKTAFSAVSVVTTTAVRPRFSHQDVLAAGNKLPISKVAGAQCLAALRKSTVSLTEIEDIVNQDPAMAAHLIKIANTALLSSGYSIRSLRRALLQIGLERIKFHVWALSAKGLFASPQLRKVWDHSILAGHVARSLSEISNVSRPDEACLLGLIHDIGQLVLAGLGRSYETSFAQLCAQGFSPVECEGQLCGSNHAQIGANLLDSWLFPADMVEAVRHHHQPSQSALPLTWLLYLTESWIESAEDVFDTAEHTQALLRLGMKTQDLTQLRQECPPDLRMLQFAA